MKFFMRNFQGVLELEQNTVNCSCFPLPKAQKSDEMADFPVAIVNSFNQKGFITGHWKPREFLRGPRKQAWWYQSRTCIKGKWYFGGLSAIAFLLSSRYLWRHDGWPMGSPTMFPRRSHLSLLASPCSFLPPSLAVVCRLARTQITLEPEL